MTLVSATAVRVSVSGSLVRVECACGDGSAVLTVGGNSDGSVRISWFWFLLGAAGRMVAGPMGPASRRARGGAGVEGARRRAPVARAASRHWAAARDLAQLGRKLQCL